MVDAARHEPTMEEIVVALRETRKGAAGVPALAVVGGRAGDEPASDETAVADLRDREIERLLTENARLNERMMFLLKLFEREQVRRAARDMPGETDCAAIACTVRETVETELRPVMLTVLRLLERQRAGASEPAHHGKSWIVDYDREPHQ
jgi:hypothetical protein